MTLVSPLAIEGFAICQADSVILIAIENESAIGVLRVGALWLYLD